MDISEEEEISQYDEDLSGSEGSDEFQDHVNMLEELKKDPSQKEFLKFLAEEDASLLTFGQEDLSDSSEDEDDEDNIEQDNIPKPKNIIVTEELFNTWKKASLEGSTQATRKIIQTFNTACHINDSGDSTKKFKSVYKIKDSQIFNSIIVFCLKNAQTIFDKILGIDTSTIVTSNENEKKHIEFNKLPKFQKMKTIIRGFLSNVNYFLNQLAETNMQSFVLRRLENLVVYYSPFFSQQKTLLKILLNLWGSAKETIRILSFFVIRRMAMDLPSPFLEHCLKGIYLTYVRNAKFVNKKTIAYINFLSNCVIEIYGIDFVKSYQCAFVYIKELASHLRKAYNTKKASKESVYNWQFINSIYAWVKVLCAYPKEKNMQYLNYPIIQLIEGLINFMPNSKYFPLRLNCIKMLIQMAKQSETYVNALPYILTIFQSKDMIGKPSFSTEKVLDVNVSLKVSKSLVGTKVFQDNIFKTAVELLLEILSLYSKTIAFPELVVPVTNTLTKFKKNSFNSSFRNEVKNILEKIRLTTQQVLEKRSEIGFSPLEIASSSKFIGENSTIISEYYEEFIQLNKEE